MNKMYFDMLRIRMVEEEIARRYPEGKMRCPVHLSIGQEAAAVGICANLGPEDKMVSTHRGHAHFLAKGGSLKGLIGELYGKSTGCSRGNGGSMHLIDLACGFYGSTSIVGGTIPIGVGLAFADRLKGSQAKTVVCIGDAAVEEGVFHEAANFASLHKLNVVFAVEDNHFSCYTPINQRQPCPDGHSVDFQAIAKSHCLDFFHASHDPKLISRAVLSVLFPALIHIPTWRFVQHCGPDNDDHLGYRDAEANEYWKRTDWNNGDFPDYWYAEINDEIDEAFADAEAAPFPDESEIGKYVYA